MEEQQFDELTRKLGEGRVSRRQLVKLVVAAVTGGVLFGGAGENVLAAGRRVPLPPKNGPNSGLIGGGYAPGGHGYHGPSNPTCAAFCQQLPPSEQMACYQQGAYQQTGPCYQCGPNGTNTGFCGTGSNLSCCNTPGSTTPDCCSATCTNLQTDVNNCGTCGNVCGAGATCSSGVCLCPGTSTVCTGSGNGCVNGACLTTCASGTYTGNQGTCNGVNSCGTTVNNNPCACINDTSGNANFCAAYATCGTACVSDADCTSVTGAFGETGPGFCSTALCCGTPPNGYNGFCAPLCSTAVCPNGQTACSNGTNNICTNTSTDVNNCGTCGNQCAVGATCSNGVCVCPGTSNQCAGSGNVCVNGACQQSCGTGQTCANYTPTNGQYCVSNTEGGTTIGLCTPGGVPPGQTCTTAACTSSADCATFNTGTQQYFCQTYTSCNGTCTGNQSVCVPFC